MPFNSLDSRKLKEQSDERIKESKELFELGEKYVSDKKKIEETLDRVRESSISEDDKKKLIETLESSIDQLQENYERNVYNEQKRINEKKQEVVKDIDEATEELVVLEESIEGIDTEEFELSSEVKDSAAEEKKKFEKLKEELLDNIKKQNDDDNSQKEKILKR